MFRSRKAWPRTSSAFPSPSPSFSRSPGVSHFLKNESDDAFKNLSGTPLFAAPETCAGDGESYSGKAADIWALGTTTTTIKRKMYTRKVVVYRAILLVNTYDKVYWMEQFSLSSVTFAACRTMPVFDPGHDPSLLLQGA